MVTAAGVHRSTTTGTLLGALLGFLLAEACSSAECAPAKPLHGVTLLGALLGCPFAEACRFNVCPPELSLHGFSFTAHSCAALCLLASVGVQLSARAAEGVFSLGIVKCCRGLRPVREPGVHSGDFNVEGLARSMWLCGLMSLLIGKH